MRFLTVKCLADEFGIAEADVRVLAKLGVLPAERHGMLWLFDHDAVDILADLLDPDVDDADYELDEEDDVDA